MKKCGRKISLFLPNLSGGGAERITVYLADGLLKRGYDVDLVLLEAAGPYLSDVPDGVRVVDLRVWSTMKGILPLSQYLRWFFQYLFEM